MLDRQQYWSFFDEYLIVRAVFVMQALFYSQLQSLQER